MIEGLRMANFEGYGIQCVQPNLIHHPTINLHQLTKSMRKPVGLTTLQANTVLVTYAQVL
jgi:hypothetical protein